MKPEIIDNRYAFYRWSSCFDLDEIRYRRLVMRVNTVHGIVSVDSWRYKTDTKYNSTLMEFIHNGMVHLRRINATYQPRYLVTLARRFAAEVAEKAVSPAGH